MIHDDFLWNAYFEREEEPNLDEYDGYYESEDCADYEPSDF